MIPILALTAWVFQPQIAENATEDGWLVTDDPAVATQNVASSDD